MYIGNAMKGNYAAVFAQLMLNGECHGMYDQKGPSLVMDIGTNFSLKVQSVKLFECCVSKHCGTNDMNQYYL